VDLSDQTLKRIANNPARFETVATYITNKFPSPPKTTPEESSLPIKTTVLFE